jgi:predicted HicB family RNase H-like nuclease
MSEIIKLSEETVKQLQEFQQSSNELVFTLGQIDFQRALIEGQRSEVLNQLADLQEKQNKLGKEIQEKHGEGNINLETGEFTKSK